MPDATTPPHPRSRLVKAVAVNKYRYHQGDGDMWPLTWAEDGNIYTAAGDNRGSPLNVWRVTGAPNPASLNHAGHTTDWSIKEVNRLPVDPKKYLTSPRVAPEWGMKPAGLLDIGGTLHLAVETHNYGQDPAFNRQTNVQGWIVTSTDYGETWDTDATDYENFFLGRVASCHFLQYGQGAASPDGWIYAYFPGASDDGNSYWCNGDYILLGRVEPERVLERAAWQFLVEMDGDNPVWGADDANAIPVFEYPRMTGEDHVSYNADLGRYILGNFSFLDEQGNPRPYHQGVWPSTVERSQLTLFESPTPWGPWSLFFQDDHWGTWGDYQPAFPPNWMFNGGTTLYMVSSGSFDDYNFVVQRFDLDVKGNGSLTP